MEVISPDCCNSIAKFALRNLKFAIILSAMLLAFCPFADAQQSKLYHVGIIHQGGPYMAVVDGLQEGLRELGYETGQAHPPGNTRYEERHKARRRGSEAIRTG